MMQLYFLSVLCNAIAGYFFVFGCNTADADIQDAAAKNDTFSTNCKLVLGLLALITGILKIIFPIHIPVIGDLIPAVAGILAGFCILFDYYNSTASVPIVLPGKIDSFLIKNRKYLGIAVLGSAIIHFFFPNIPLF